MQEVWRPVVGYEGFYEVSDQARVRGVERVLSGGRRVKSRLLKQSLDSYGYRIVGLSRNGKTKTITVHKVVALAFLGPKPDGMIVLHGPAGKADNSLSNLSYGTWAKNSGPDRERDGTLMRGKCNHKTKLTETDVRVIRKRLALGESQQAIANSYGVVQYTISMIKLGRNWGWLA